MKNNFSPPSYTTSDGYIHNVHYKLMFENKERNEKREEEKMNENLCEHKYTFICFYTFMNFAHYAPIKYGIINLNIMETLDFKALNFNVKSV